MGPDKATWVCPACRIAMFGGKGSACPSCGDDMMETTTPGYTAKLPVIYIAGPYKAPTPWQVLANIRAAQEVSLRVWKLGAVALCPHSNTGLFDGECEERVWLDGDLELLRRCDAVLMLDTWRASAGARAERALAERIGIPVYEQLAVLRRWIVEWKVSHASGVEE